MSRHIVFVEASTTGAGELANHWARKLGCRVTLLSRRSESYAPAIVGSVDAIVRCETNDAAQVAAAVRQLHGERGIDAVTTTADMYVPQAARAAEALGLPTMSYDAAISARNKYRMRTRLAEVAPEFNPAFALACDLAEAEAAAARIGYPLIAKPQDENDGVDVRLIRTPDDLARYMAHALAQTANSAGQSRAAGVLLEEYLQGPEFSVETVIPRGGPVQVMAVVAKELTGVGRGCFVECGDRLPYLGPEAAPLAAAVTRILEGLRIDCAVTHTECRIVDGQVKVLEVNPRLAGEKLGSHLIEIATGRSAVQALIEVAFGEPVRWHPARAGGAAMFNPWADRRGRFRGVANLAEVRAMPGVVEVALRVEPGAPVQPPLSNGDLLADILAEGATSEEAYARARAAGLHARFEIEPETVSS